MRSKFTWILTLFFVFVVQVGFAQQKKVTGVVKTQDGDPIPGATVLLVGTKEGTDTDLEGTYSLNVKKGDKIKVEFLGFKAVVVTVTDSNVLNVTLQEEEIDMLDEIVIDQYRTMSKQESTVSQTTITSKTIEGRPNANVIQTLQGQVPGLNIMTGSGQPGSDNIDIKLRGVGSINGSTKPLFVVDGVPLSDDRFRSINPNDIETITVLKDAGATAIYGNRGANGVIVITTKRGAFDQDLSIKYSGLTGIQYLQKEHYNLFDGPGLMKFERYAFDSYNGIMGKKWNEKDIQNATTTDWADVFFGPAVQQNHTLSISLGSKNLASSTSIGYADYEGVLKSTSMQRFNLRSNLNGKNNDGRLNFSTSIGLNYSKNKMLSSPGSNNIYHNYFIGAFRGLPYLNPSDYNFGNTIEDTERAYQDFNQGSGSSPIVLLNRRNNFGYGQNEFKMNVNGMLSYKLSDKLTIANQAGVDYQSINQPQWGSPNAWTEWKQREADEADNKERYTGFYGEAISQRFVFTNTASLKYAEVFNEKHTLNVGLYTEYLKGHLNETSMRKVGFDPLFWAPGAGTGSIVDTDKNDYYVPTVGKVKQSSGLFSYFANAGYDFDKRFGIDATIRRDASFRFTKENQWGTFWSVAGRWNISNEKWMENSIFTELKLRGSYGTSGNQDILGTGVFGGANLFSPLYSVISGYDEGSLLAGLGLTQLPNSDLRWETTTQANIGVDFGLFNNRLRGTVDVYNKTTDDLFLRRFLSAVNGTSSIAANFGSMENKGVELLLEGDIVRNETTKITLRANGAYNNNKVIEIPDESGFSVTGITGYKVGQPFNEYYMYKYVGVNPKNGEALFQTKDGGVTETPTDDDLFWTGKTMWPKYQGSFGIDVAYKGWFLTANFTYAQDVYRYDNDYLWFTNASFIGKGRTFNMSEDLYGAWTKTNKDATIPALNAKNNTYFVDSDFYIKDASYLRLRFVSLGYNFNKSDLDFLNLSGLRVFVQGENLHTWTKWKGWDAESSRGVDLGQYPTPRSVSFGVEVQF